MSMLIFLLHVVGGIISAGILPLTGVVKIIVLFTMPRALAEYK